jgi:hypothetical protein
MRHPIQLPNYMGCLMEFYTFLTLLKYENEFQNPQIFQQTISLFPEQSTIYRFCRAIFTFIYIPARWHHLF